MSRLPGAAGIYIQNPRLLFHQRTMGVSVNYRMAGVYFRIDIQMVDIMNDIQSFVVDFYGFILWQLIGPSPHVHVSPHRHDRGLGSQHLEDPTPPYIPCVDDHLHP